MGHCAELHGNWFQRFVAHKAVGEDDVIKSPFDCRAAAQVSTKRCVHCRILAFVAHCSL